MKKHIRGMRVLCILIALLLAVQTGATLSGSESLDSYAASDGNFTFEVIGSTATITGYSGSETNLVIPSTVTDGTNTYSVTNIGDYAFSEDSSLKSISLPTSVTSIGTEAFWKCTNLTSITIPTAVTVIGYAAFSDCSSLTSITVSSGNTQYSSLNGVLLNYDKTVLIQCPGDKAGAFTIPSSVTSIVDIAFSNCGSLTSIAVSGGNTKYSSLNGVLYNLDKTGLIRCPGGKAGTFTIPTSVTSLGESAFYKCSSLTSIIIPNSITSLSDGCFNSCTSLIKITIPNSVTSLGDNCFSYCSSLTSITLSNRITNLGWWGFYKCTSLTSIVFPNSVSYIADGAFEDCTSLNSITIPNSVTGLGVESFYGCTSLTSIIIPNSVTNIGMFCFDNCDNLTKAYFLGNAPTLGQDVFTDCADTFKAYYLVGKTGFTNPWHGYTTVKSTQVKFNSQGGTAVGSVIVNYNSLVKAPTSPTRTGYTFGGWYKEAACTNAWIFSTGKATANITLYAKWRTPITSATSYSYNSIKVSWSGAGSATSYKIYRATSATGTYALVHTSLSTTRSWIDTGRTTGKNYYYKVYPVAGGKTYTFSTYKYAQAIPSTPTATLTKSTTTSIKVSWTGVAGATKYQIYRATSSTGTYSLVYTASSTARSWVNTGRTLGKYYYYKVRAYHLEGTTKVYGICSAVKYIKM
jgi:uncharacterized repeat protein (TIGR02543 family)